MTLTRPHHQPPPLSLNPSDSAKTRSIKRELSALRAKREEIANHIRALGPRPRMKKEKNKSDDDEKAPTQPQQQQQQPQRHHQQNEEKKETSRKRGRVHSEGRDENEDEPERKGSRRMFGSLVLGTLRKSIADEEKNEQKQEARRRLMREAEEKAERESEEIFTRSVEKWWESRESLIERQIQIELETKLRQKDLYYAIAEDCEAEIAEGKIRTEAMPRLFWKPRRETIQTQSQLARQPGKVKEWLKEKIEQCEQGRERVEARKAKFEEEREKRKRGEHVEEEEEGVEEEDDQMADADADAEVLEDVADADV